MQRRSRYTRQSNRWYDTKLATANTPAEKWAIRQIRSEKDRLFFRREAKRVLKESGWTLDAIATWLNVPRPELDGLTPNEGLKIARDRFPYPRKVFHLLLADLKVKLSQVRIRDTVINFED